MRLLNVAFIKLPCAHIQLYWKLVDSTESLYNVVFVLFFLLGNHQHSDSSSGGHECLSKQQIVVKFQSGPKLWEDTYYPREPTYTTDLQIIIIYTDLNITVTNYSGCRHLDLVNYQFSCSALTNQTEYHSISNMPAVMSWTIIYLRSVT